MLGFASPWLFCLLPLPLLVFWLSKDKSKLAVASLKIPFFDVLLPYLKQQDKKNQSIWQPSMIWLSMIWLLLIIASARPVYIGDPITSPSIAHNIMLAIDISGSMDIDDMHIQGHPASRLQAIKAVANQFIQARQGDRLGLIVFGSQAYLLTPMSYDRNIVRHMLDDATVGLAGPMTAVGDAIGLAVKKLQVLPNDSRVLILLTDGVSNSGSLDPNVATRLAKDHHVKIYTIGFGADKVGVPTVFGTEYVNPSADLDETTLRRIASETGGLYFRATNVSDLAQVYQAINQLEPVHAKQPYRPEQELYALPLGLALLLSCYLAWRRSGLTLAWRRQPGQNPSSEEIR